MWKSESITFSTLWWGYFNGIGNFWKTTNQAIFRKSWVRVLGTVTWKKPLSWRLQKALKLRFLPLFFQGSIITDSYSGIPIIFLICFEKDLAARNDSCQKTQVFQNYQLQNESKHLWKWPETITQSWTICYKVYKPPICNLGNKNIGNFANLADIFAKLLFQDQSFHVYYIFCEFVQCASA